MEWSELKAQIKKNLSQPSGDDTGTWMDAEYLAEANNYMRELATISGCLASEATFSSVANQGEYAEKDDVSKVSACYFDDGSGFVPLEITSIEQLDEAELEGKITSPWREERGDPQYWYPDPERGVIGFFPIPDADGTDNLKKRYLEQVTEMTVSTSVPFNDEKSLYDFHRVIVYGVVAHFKDIEGESSTSWWARYEAGKKQLRRHTDQDYKPIQFNLVSRKRGIHRDPGWGLGL